MGLPCIFIGIIFLANPCIRMLDILPDLIGCILIIIGTSKLAHVESRLADAKKYAVYFAFISALKIPLSFYIFTKEKGYLLPATFIYSVLEGVLMVGMFVSLIGGLEYLTSREKCDDKHIRNSENASVICFIFSIARAVVSFAPELLSLGTQKDSFDYTFAPTPEQNAALLKPYAELLAFGIIFIFGIYFLIVCGKYFITLSRDKAFISALRSRHESYLVENADKVNLGRVRCALMIFFFAVLLLFNQIIDHLNVIPNTFTFLFLIAGTIYMIKMLGCSKLIKTLPVYIPLTILSLYNNITQYRLLSETNIDFINDHMIIRSVPETLKDTGSLPMIVISVLAEYVVIAVLMFIIAKSLDNLPFMREKDTVSIYEILFGIGTVVYFASSIYVYAGQFIRTVFTYMSESIDVYVKYDSILAVCEWTSLISFLVMLYTASKYGTDLLYMTKPEKEDIEY